MEKDKGYTIVQDESPVNPRENDNLWHFAFWHRRYSLGDTDVDPNPQAYLYSLFVAVNDTDKLYNLLKEDGEDIDAVSSLSTEWLHSRMQEKSEEVIHALGEYYYIHPVYMYDHSGITISLSPFSCKWDSGQLGFAVLGISTAQEEYGITAKESAYKILEAEIGEYDAYIRGDCYGYVLDDCFGGESCFGYTSESEAEQAAQRELEFYKKNHGQGS